MDGEEESTYPALKTNQSQPEVLQYFCVRRVGLGYLYKGLLINNY